MARIRTIKPDFFRHEGLYEAEKVTGLPLRVAFAGLWTAADREGRFKWLPRTLKLDALPHDEVDFSRVLDALLTRGHVLKYVIDGVAYGCIPSWHEHQVVNNRESQSEIPPPTDSSIESTTSTRYSRVDDATVTPLVHAPVEGKGREGKGKEGEGDRAVRKPAAEAAPTLTIADLISDGVSSDHAAAWLRVRKEKRAPLTQVAWEATKAHAAKAGITTAQAVHICAIKGWQAFDAGYSWQGVIDTGHAAPRQTRSGDEETPEQKAARREEGRRLLFGNKTGDIIDA